MSAGGSHRDVPILASAARTATPTIPDFPNPGYRGLHVVIDVTAAPGPAPSVVFTVRGRDPLSGKAYDLLVSAAITAVGTTVLKVYPGIGVVANGAASDVLPSIWTVSAVHGNANSVTYALHAVLVK